MHVVEHSARNANDQHFQTAPCPVLHSARYINDHVLVQLDFPMVQTHSPLALLPVADQESEITQSKMVLEQLLGRPAPGFSYPHGSVSVHTIALVRRSGFAFACASEADVTSLRSNRFALPRFWVPDWDGRAFSRWLLRWIRR